MNQFVQATTLGNGINYPATALGGPRRMFGSYPSEAALAAPNGLAAGMFSDDLMGYGLDDGGDHGDPKRRRIARV